MAMLKDSLFKILFSDHRENKIKATLEINKNSEIFTGHFPGQPVLPGACMIQIVKEILESVLTLSFRLKKADSIKFLKVIDPGINHILELTVNYTIIKNDTFYITASLTAQKEIFFKMKGSFIAG